MPRKITDLTGETFGRLTVVSLPPTRSKNGRVLWRCRCSCGEWVPAVHGSNLRGGHTTSCGCYHREVVTEVGRSGRTHGLSHATGNGHYKRWEGMKQRCNNMSNPHYKNYGARGISVYPEWNTERGFIAFKNWLDENLGPCPEGYSLDRIDNDGNYEPGNLRWASAKVQINNRRNSLDGQ